MRSPRLWRNLALTLLAFGPFAILAAAQLPASDATNAARAFGFVFGAAALFFGGVFALLLHMRVRTAQALERGEDVLARWRIDASAWRDFVALNATLDRRPAAYANELSIRDEVPAEGVIVTAGKTAIDIDGSVHFLPLRGTPEITRAAFNETPVPPSYIELDLLYPGAGDVQPAPTRTCLRFPVPPGAQADARRLVQHYGGELPGMPDFFHGRGDGGDPEDLSKCWTCGYQTHRFQSHCPECGSVLQSRRWSRRFGGVLVVCGLIVTVIAGAALYDLTPLMLHPGVEIDGSRFNGTPQFALGVLGLLGVVLAFGVIALVYGIWQMKTGQRSKILASAMVGIFSFLMLIAWLMKSGA